LIAGARDPRLANWWRIADPDTFARRT